jgi:hypothetical protein
MKGNKIMKIYTHKDGPEGFMDGTAFILVDEQGNISSLNKGGVSRKLYYTSIENIEDQVSRGNWKRVYPPPPKRYNHMFDVAFTVEGPWENWEDVPLQFKIGALQKRLDYLRNNPEDAAEAFGYSDSYELED